MIFRLILLVASANVALAAWKGSVYADGFEFAYFADGTDNTNWNKARDLCSTKYQAIGAMFAMLKTYNINYKVGTLLYDYQYPRTWVGGWDEYAEGFWTWIDGTPFSDTYTNWNPGEPSNSANEDWLEINYQYDKGWNDKTWGALRGYLCQIPENSMKSAAFSELTIYDGEHFARTFWGANKECERIGARLVKIEDERSRQSILKRVKNAEKYWIDNENTRSGCSVLTRAGYEEYECNNEAFGFLCETARPNLLKISDEQPVVAESGYLEIECTAFGYPIPDVVWQVEDDARTVVPNQIIGVGSATLVIQNASPADAKHYICAATNTIDGKMNKVIGVAEVSVVSGAN